MKFTKNMTEGSIYKNFLRFAVPLMLSYLLSQAYATIDAVIAGKFISENALGAISATGSYELMFNSLFSGFAAGFGIYIAQQFGKGDHGSVRRDLLTMGIVVAVASGAVSLATIGFREPIMRYLKVDAVLWDDAQTYFVIYTLGYALSYVNMLLIQTLYALGCTSFTLYVSFITAALKTGGNLLSVLVLHWGVAGLAAVSVLANLAATVCYLFLLRRAFRELNCKKEPYRFRFSCVRSSLRYAIPAAVQQVSFHGVGMLIAPSVNGLGAAATTGYNISNRLYNLGTMSLWAVSNAFNSYTAQCVGKGDSEKIPKGLKAGFILNSVMLLPFVVALAIFAGPVVSLFFPQGVTGEAYSYAMRYAAVFLPFVYVQLTGHMLHCYMRCLGSMTTVLGITIFGSAVRVIATVLLVPRMHIEGAYWGQIISWAADAVVSTVLVLRFYRTREQLQAITDRIRQTKS